MSTEERDLEENKGGQQEEEFKPKDEREEKALDENEMGNKGEEENLGKKDRTDQCNPDVDQECKDDEAA